MSQRILNVQLDRRIIGEEMLPQRWYSETIGGIGLAVRYLLEDLHLTKPLLKDPIIVMTGPLTGTPFPGTSRAIVVSYRNDSRLLRITSIGGKFPAYLRFAGFDGLVISGMASSPVRLLIKNKESRIVDASMLWGKDLVATEMAIYEERRDMATLAIGPAGENENPYATVVTDRFLNRGAGSGSDFGVKKLKHIAVEPDGALGLSPELEKAVLLKYRNMKTFSSPFYTDEMRRSCFGCAKCCWKYDPEDGIVLLQNDLDEMATIFPSVSVENRAIYYKQCSRLGIDFHNLSHSLKNNIADSQFEDFISRLTSFKAVCSNDLIASHSREEAQLMLHRWYSDIDFERVYSIDELIDRENAVMVKNCLPICEHLSIYFPIYTELLVSICGLDSGFQEFLKIGDRLVRQLLSLYYDLGYSEMRFDDHMVYKDHFPKVFVDQPNRYLKLRRLTGK